MNSLDKYRVILTTDEIYDLFRLNKLEFNKKEIDIINKLGFSIKKAFYNNRQDLFYYKLHIIDADNTKTAFDIAKGPDDYYYIELYYIKYKIPKNIYYKCDQLIELKKFLILLKSHLLSTNFNIKQLENLNEELSLKYLMSKLSNHYTNSKDLIKKNRLHSLKKTSEFLVLEIVRKIRENIKKNKLYQKSLERKDYIDLDTLGKLEVFDKKELEKIKNIVPDIVNVEVNYLNSKIRSIRLSLYSKDTIYNDNNNILNKYIYIKSNNYLLHLYIVIYKFKDDYYYLSIRYYNYKNIGWAYDDMDMDEEKYIIFENVFDQFPSIINYLKYIFS